MLKCANGDISCPSIALYLLSDGFCRVDEISVIARNVKFVPGCIGNELKFVSNGRIAEEVPRSVHQVSGVGSFLWPGNGSNSRRYSP